MSKAFNNVKDELCKSPILKNFDPSKETCLQTDASRLNGIGYALLQKHSEKWHLITSGSRFLSETESRYATIELEMLAVVHGINKCKLYLLGLPQFTLKVDHRPLVNILDKLDQITNTRLQRLREKLSHYRFNTVWIPGKKHAIPDALSRSPIDPPEETMFKEEEICLQQVLNAEFNINQLDSFVIKVPSHICKKIINNRNIMN